MVWGIGKGERERGKGERLNLSLYPLTFSPTSPSPSSPSSPQSPVLGYISLWTCQKGLQGARHEIVAKNGVREAPALEFSDSQACNDIGTGMWLNQL